MGSLRSVVPDPLGVSSPSRLAADLEKAASFSGEGPGVTRFAWSRELAAADEWLAERMRDAGPVVGQGAAGHPVPASVPAGAPAGVRGGPWAAP